MSRVSKGDQSAPNERLVELVDPQGVPIGSEDKLTAHRPPGILHRAISGHVVDERSGRILVQKRALTKYHSPGLWSNSVCSHPEPGERPEAATSRRLREELGICVRPEDVANGVITVYKVTDERSGLVEYEYNHVFIISYGGPVTPDAAEVADVRWIDLAELTSAANGLAGWTAWFPIVVRAALPSITAVLVASVPS